MKEIEPGYQENFEDVLRNARLEGRSCQIYLMSNIVFVGKVRAVDGNAIHLECNNGFVAFIRPQTVMALFTQDEVLLQPKQPSCPWCGKE